MSVTNTSLCRVQDGDGRIQRRESTIYLISGLPLESYSRYLQRSHNLPYGRQSSRIWSRDAARDTFQAVRDCVYGGRAGSGYISAREGRAINADDLIGGRCDWLSVSHDLSQRAVPKWYTACYSPDSCSGGRSTEYRCSTRTTARWTRIIPPHGDACHVRRHADRCDRIPDATLRRPCTGTNVQ